MKTLVIAEAGVNHNGDIDLAKNLIIEAANAGADLVKFQSFVAKSFISKFAPKADYQKQRSDGSESQLDMVRKLELSKEEHQILIDECSRNNIGFLSTAFDKDSFDLLTELGVDSFVKIPSGEITNKPYMRYVTRFHPQVLLSTGMATLGDIEAAINVIENEGTDRKNITVMHCTTEYPAPMDEVNLNAMKNIGDAFGVNMGYSDHTAGIEVALAAVALGAQVIEKHFTLNRELPGPDHRASLEPSELCSMIIGIRNIEKALGDGIKRPSASELKNISVARKSLVASRHIKAGDKFSELNITAKRPGTGLSPMRWDEVIGRVSTREYLPDEMIEL